jgi:hypothetical protein
MNIYGKSTNSSERGQAFLVVVVFVAVFLLVVLGIAADYTQVWAHRQMAQGAADAACQAGAADIYLQSVNANASGSNGIGSFAYIGTDYDCDTNTASAPCAYAALNGYSGKSVHVSFPGSLPGVSAIPAGFGSVAHPYIEVKITDPIGMSLTKLVSASTVSMSAKAGCGLNPVSVPVPLVILHQSAAGSLSVTGAGSINIIGGPNRSIQVDSNNTGAVSVGTVDLHLAGPTRSGADFGVFGGPSTKPGGVNVGTSGKWVQPASPFGDPWAIVNAPPKPSAGTATPVPFAVNGCPDPAGCVELTPGDYSGCTSGTIAPGANGCLVFPYGGSNSKFNAGGAAWQPNHNYAKGDLIQPIHSKNSGDYVFQAQSTGTSGANANQPVWSQTILGAPQNDNGISWQNMGPVSTTPNTAIFDPGLYYVGSTGFGIKQATVRTSTATGDGTNGLMFYFTGGGTVTVTANAGKSSACTAASPGLATPNGCVVSYKKDGSNSSAATGSVPMRVLKCPAATVNPPSDVPTAIDGDILLGPCSGTYGSSDSKNRGFLFFQAHSNSATPSWGGGGQFLLSGFMYFHSNSAGASCGSNTTCLNMDGGSGSGSFTLGNLVADQVKMNGNSSITMILNPAVTFQVLRPTLLE